MSDPGKYRTKDEVEEMMRHDPIIQFGRSLIDHHRYSQAELDAVIPLLPKLKPVWPRPERMVVRGTVLVPHRSALVALG